MIWTVDVTHSTSFPVNPDGDGWRRYRIEAPDATTAELVACQMCASHAGWTPVRSIVIDWECGERPTSPVRPPQRYGDTAGTTAHQVEQRPAEGPST